MTRNVFNRVLGTIAAVGLIIIGGYMVTGAFLAVGRRRKEALFSVEEYN